MLDAENCAQVATDVTGNVVAVLQGPTHAVSVWEFAGEPSVPPRFVPVGNPADELELLAVGGARAPRGRGRGPEGAPVGLARARAHPRPRPPLALGRRRSRHSPRNRQRKQYWKRF